MSTSIAENTSLSELLDRYVNEVAPSKKSEVDIKYRTKLLNTHLGHLIIAGITPLTIKEYRDYRLESVKADTVRKELSLLGRVMKLAQREWDIYLPRGNLVDSIGLKVRGVIAALMMANKSACFVPPANTVGLLKT